MQPRQPRLGDILDDYCPRERRLTNHAVVAMVGEDVRLTRCTTCDAEHEYKNAKIPAQRKKKTGTAALYDEVLTGGPAKLAPPVASPPVATTPEPALSEPARTRVADDAQAEAPVEPVGEAPPDSPRKADDSDGPVHRPLIRATLPRPEGQPKERPIPEFTARTAAMRHGRFRPPGGGQAQGQGPRVRNGQASQNGNQAGGHRPGRRGHFAAAGAPGQGNRPQAPQGERQGHRRRGRKRSK